MMNFLGLVSVLFFSSQSILAKGMPDNWSGGMFTTDDPFIECPGASELTAFSTEGGGVFLNDISRGKIKKIPKGVSYKKLEPNEQGPIRELYEVKQPLWPTGKYLFIKDATGKVLKVNIISDKSDRELKKEGEVVLSNALRDNASSVKVPTSRELIFEHTAEGCKLASSTLNFKVFPIEDNKLVKSDLYSSAEEYSEVFCNKFNELNSKNPDLMKKIEECSFGGSKLLTETRGFLEKTRELSGYDKAPPWTPNTHSNHDAISNVRLGARSIEDIVALSEFPHPQSVLRSMMDLKTLCDENYSMFHASNVKINKKLSNKSSDNSSTPLGTISK